MRTLYDENFFLKHSGGPVVDLNLPLRLQKRQLLEKLGFSLDSSLKSCQVVSEKIIIDYIEVYSKYLPFIIIVSEKPMPTLVPPLFIFYSTEKIIWRNCFGEKVEINFVEFLKQIKNFNKSTWLEFTYPIWGDDTIAGRLSYESHESQIIELQKGAFPSKIMHNYDLFSYSGRIYYCDLKVTEYFETVKFLKELGYNSILSYSIIERICFLFKNKIQELENLKKISLLPTLEFAFRDDWIVIIDIDWSKSFITTD
ncbi:MAG: hypothetical protein ACOYMB_03810 [Patescibacteria group bacterium]